MEGSVGDYSMDLERIATHQPPPLPTNDLRARGAVEANDFLARQEKKNKAMNLIEKF